MSNNRLLGPDGLPLTPRASRPTRRHKHIAADAPLPVPSRAPRHKGAAVPAALPIPAHPVQSPPNRARMLGSGDGAPYDAASVFSEHTAAWRPYLWSPDGELNMYRDRIVARVRDLVRNDGWASGAVTRICDNVIGGAFRPKAKPDYRALALHSGNSRFDAAWADEFARALEARYRTWADDPGRWCDGARSLTLTQLMGVGFRHKLVDGDALAVMLWLDDRVGLGRARYATAVQLIDPDRLSNPQLRFDSMAMRGGVVVDELGAATGYYIREAHQGDWWSAAQSLTWDYIPRETAWGRPIVVHDYDHYRAGQHRGGAGVLAPVVTRLKMLAKYDSTELDAAIINAIFGAYVESPFDPEMVQDALGGNERMSRYQQAQAEFHGGRHVMIGDVVVPIMAPGEKINAVAAERPSGNFAAFESAVLRNVATATGMSSPQISGNWSDTNYSSARAALLEAWKTLARRRTDYAVGFATPIWVCFVEEAMEIDDLPLPAGDVPDFIECRGAYSRCRWIGPGRGWIDPVAEKQGAVLGMDAGLSTLEQECAENAGADWEETLDQRAIEIAGYRSRGLAVPSWAGMQSANDVSRKPADPEVQ